LATSDKKKRPSARVVLLKEFDEKGFVFFTNYKSRKANDIADNKNVALLFYWPYVQKQVRIEGIIKKVKKKVSTEYFYTRPLDSQIAAIISPQSKMIPNRDYLEQNFNTFKHEDLPIKKPDYWGGYIVKPERLEFWQGRENRLHDRVVYEIKKKEWVKYRIAP
jgi:pyridoxamine 5'-phosphate oxidase